MMVVPDMYMHGGGGYVRTKHLYVNDDTAWRKIKEAWMHDGTDWRLVYKFNTIPAPSGTIPAIKTVFKSNVDGKYYLYAGNWDGGVYKWDGSSWVLVFTAPNRITVLKKSTDGSVLFIGCGDGTTGLSGGIYSWNNSAVTTIMPYGTSRGIGSITDNSGIIYFTVYQGIYSWNGTLTQIGSTTFQELVIFTDNLYLIAGGASIYRWNGGTSWTNITLPGAYNINSFISISGVLYVALTSATVYLLYTYNGGVWTYICAGSAAHSGLAYCKGKFYSSRSRYGICEFDTSSLITKVDYIDAGGPPITFDDCDEIYLGKYSNYEFSVWKTV